MSDRDAGIPDLQTRMDDIRAVMDAVGSKRAAIMGVSEGGPMSELFAATYPERTAALVLWGTGASYLKADDYPWGLTPQEWADLIRQNDPPRGSQEWLDERLRSFVPSMADDMYYRRWWRRWVLSSASPGAVLALRRMNSQIDARHALPSIHVPTLIVHRVGDEVEEGRYIAARIPGARMVELPGADHAWWYKSGEIVDQVEPFLRGIWERGEWDLVETDRVLATVMFTDIVDSTATLAEIGDRAWRDLLSRHHGEVRRQLVRFAGREVDTAGDGFFAAFDGPARAVRCARAITSSVADIGLQVRAGLHTGECEVVDGKMGGIAVHIGARVAAQAQAGEVLVSSTVKDLVAGSGIEFEERGVVALKGLPGEWRLYAVGGA